MQLTAAGTTVDGGLRPVRAHPVSATRVARARHRVPERTYWMVILGSSIQNLHQLRAQVARARRLRECDDDDLPGRITPGKRARRSAVSKDAIVVDAPAVTI